MNAGIKFGGLGKTMEIDELKIGAKRKYKRGRVSVPCMNTYPAALMSSPGSGTSEKNEHSSSCWRTLLNSFNRNKIAIENGSFRSHHVLKSQ